MPVTDRNAINEVLIRWDRRCLVVQGAHVARIRGRWDDQAIAADGTPGDWVPGTDRYGDPEAISLADEADVTTLKTVLGDAMHGVLMRLDELEGTVAAHVANAAAKDANMQDLLTEAQAAKDAATAASTAQATAQADADALRAENIGLRGQLADALAKLAAQQPAPPATSTPDPAPQPMQGTP